MTDQSAVARDYLAIWNDPDDEARRERLSQTWAPDAHYVDPIMNGDGVDGINTMIAGARKQFPGHVFRLAGTPDGHGRFVRFSWTLAPELRAVVASGTDVVRLDDAGRVAEVIGFLDGVPA